MKISKSFPKKIISFLFIILTYGAAQVDYGSQIQTIFDNNCTSCHGSSGVQISLPRHSRNTRHLSIKALSIDGAFCFISIQDYSNNTKKGTHF